MFINMLAQFFKDALKTTSSHGIHVIIIVKLNPGVHICIMVELNGVLFKMYFSTQLIYDFKDGCGTFGFVCVDLDKVPKETLESLRLIGANIPDDMRYSTVGTLKNPLL